MLWDYNVKSRRWNVRYRKHDLKVYPYGHTWGYQVDDGDEILYFETPAEAMDAAIRDVMTSTGLLRGVET